MFLEIAGVLINLAEVAYIRPYKYSPKQELITQVTFKSGDKVALEVECKDVLELIKKALNPPELDPYEALNTITDSIRDNDK